MAGRRLQDMNAIDYRNKNVVSAGASCGFGEEFARQLAPRGANTVHVARRAERLEKLAHAIGVRLQLFLPLYVAPKLCAASSITGIPCLEATSLMPS